MKGRIRFRHRSTTALVSLLGCLAVVGLLAGCSPPQPDEPTGITPEVVAGYRFRGEMAWAYFFEDAECSWTFVDLFVTNSRISSIGSRSERIAEAYLYINNYDFCLDLYRTGFGYTDLSSSDFQVGNRLESATLTKSFRIEDTYFGSEPYELDVSITWTASGPLQRDRTKQTHQEPGYKFRYWFDGDFRDATAEGSFDFEDERLELSGWGQLVDARQGYMSVAQENRRPPFIEYFDAEPRVILPGESSTLQWSVDDERARVTIDQGLGSFGYQGDVTVSPTVTTTYLLTATNRNGSTSAEATVYVLAPDRFEPNDSSGTAASVDTHTYYDDLTLVPGDVDWFVFTMPAAATVDVYLDTWQFEPVMALFDDASNELATGSSYLSTGLEPGTYHLAVSGSPDTGFGGNHEQRGVYALSMTWTPAIEPDLYEPNDSYPTATQISLDFASPELTIRRGDVDWFEFTLAGPASMVVAADIDAAAVGSSLDSVLGLFDADLNLVGANDDHDGLDSRLELSLEPGRYYLAVSGFDDLDFVGNHSQQGLYYLTVTTVP